MELGAQNSNECRNYLQALISTSESRPWNITNLYPESNLFESKTIYLWGRRPACVFMSPKLRCMIIDTALGNWKNPSFYELILRFSPIGKITQPRTGRISRLYYRALRNNNFLSFFVLFAGMFRYCMKYIARKLVAKKEIYLATLHEFYAAFLL